MKILFCTNSLGAKGGIEKVTIVKANAFADRPGNEVMVCYTDKGTYPESTIHPLSPKVKTHDLGVTFWDLSLSRPHEAIKKFLRLRQALKAIIDSFDPDVVISTGSYEKFALASLTLKKAVKIREYHFSSTYRNHTGNNKLKIAGYIDNHLVGRFFDQNVLLTKQDLESNFPGAKNFCYQYNPCTCDTPCHYEPREKENIVIAVGRLSEQKYYVSLLRIWSLINDRTKGWKLQIVGRGEQEEFLKSEAKRLGIGSSVEFMGFQKDPVSLMAKAKIIALTSKYEGLPLNLLEAIHVGTVPISYEFAYGPRDVIDDGVDGVLVDFLNEEQFAEKLWALMSMDDAALSCMAQAANKKAKMFGIEKITDDWMSKYTALIRDKRDKKGL